MQLYFDHTKGFGKMQDQVFFYVPFGAFFEPHEHNKALETGWFPTASTLWFQSRSTRIKVADYSANRTTLKNVKKVKSYPNLGITEAKKNLLKNIYEKYVKYKNFKEVSYNIDEMLSNSHGNIFYAYQNNLIGFLFFKTINKNFLAIEFAWDYENPSLSLGNVSMHYAWQLARFKRCEYIYMSAGYESCCSYKADYKGFEWWTGVEWSRDINLYKQLCHNDSKINILNYNYI